MEFSDEQLEAIEFDVDNRLFIAGPGTGKSSSILGFINYAKNSLSTNLSSIYVLTFTRVATAELKKSIKETFSSFAELPNVYTLHGFSLRQVLKNTKRVSTLPDNFTIADDFDERSIIYEDLKRMLSLNKISEVKDLFQKLSSNWETLNADRTGWESDFELPEFIGAWKEHREIYGYALRSELVYQFKNILTQEDEISIDGPIDFLLVDEYQDLNRCDLKVIHELNKRGAHLVCAGDDDQSIYTFRYAFPEGIRQYSDNIPDSKQFQFTRCFRCDQLILGFSLQVIRQDYRRIPKEIKSETGENGFVQVLRFRNQKTEALKIAEIIESLTLKDDISAKDVIILLRSNYRNVFSEIIEAELVDKGISVITGNSDFELFDSIHGRYLSSIIKLVMNLNNDLAYRCILQLTHRVGPVNIERIYITARNENKRFSEICIEIGKGLRNDIQINAATHKILVKIVISEEITKAREGDFKESLDKLILMIPNVTEEFKALIEQFLSENGINSFDTFIQVINDFLGPQERDISTVDAVRIMTMHQAKGLSAKAVFVIAVEEEYVPGRGDVDEERRLLYVSLTRAKNYLFLTVCNNRIERQSFTGFQRYPGSRRQISRFIKDLPDLPIQNGEKFNMSS